jgi:hypothetical protein
MTSPLGVLPVGPTAATTEVVEDVNGGPPWGCCWRVWQQPPQKLLKTSMAPPGGVPVCPAAATIEVVEDVDGGPGGATSGSDSGHH